MNEFFQDIVNQSADMQAALNYYLTPEYMKKFEQIRQLKYSKIIFTGMGSSNFGSVGASLFLNQHKINSYVISASQLLHYGLNSIDEDTLLIMVSQSGESGEILGLLERLEGHVTIIGITNNPQSTLAQKSTISLFLHVAEEESVTTRTYLATLIANNLLARYLVGGRDGLVIAEFEKAISFLEHFTQQYQDSLDTISQFFKTTQFISCVGRGPSYGSALAAGLFFKEVAKFPSDGMDSAEFRHGPIEIVDSKFGAVVFAPAGNTAELSITLAKDIAVKGGKVLLITDIENSPEHDNILTFKYNQISEYLSPLIEIVGAQLVCNVLAEKQGFIPGKFRWSKKINGEK